jgi:hypothetical protein
MDSQVSFAMFEHRNMEIKLRNLDCSLEAENSCDSNCSSISRCKQVGSRPMSWASMQAFVRQKRLIGALKLVGKKSVYPLCFQFKHE